MVKRQSTILSNEDNRDDARERERKREGERERVKAWHGEDMAWRIRSWHTATTKRHAARGGISREQAVRDPAQTA